jgi:uncharacterized coiled-coil protein SlyX
LSEPYIIIVNEKMDRRMRGHFKGDTMSEKRFTALETMVAYHEDTIQKLNDVIYKQQLEIDRLKEKVDSFARLLKDADQRVADESDN